ncbi:MAG: hypothetical protein ACE5K4_07545 [Candidatus Hydrothermarchaeota archaeon]
MIVQRTFGILQVIIGLVLVAVASYYAGVAKRVLGEQAMFTPGAFYISLLLILLPGILLFLGGFSLLYALKKPLRVGPPVIRDDGTFIGEVEAIKLDPSTQNVRIIMKREEVEIEDIADINEFIVVRKKE